MLITYPTLSHSEEGVLFLCLVALLLEAMYNPGYYLSIAHIQCSKYCLQHEIMIITFKNEFYYLNSLQRDVLINLDTEQYRIMLIKLIET